MKTKFRHKVVFKLLTPIAALIFRIKYRFYGVKFKSNEVKGPYLIFGNHTQALDPLFLATSFNEPIYFVASDMIFTKPILSKIMSYLVSPIPKAKYKADSDTVKNIIKIAKSGGSIGLFPEGNTTFFGDLMEVPYSTAKLVKHLKLPVLFYHIEGGYLTKPRWAKEKRKGKMRGKVTKVWQKEDYESLSLDEIYKQLVSYLRFNDYLSNETKKQTFKSKNKAHYIETAFFVSPETRAFNTIYSDKNDVFDRSSDLHLRIDSYGKFHRLGGTVQIEDTIAWHKIQIEEVNKVIESKEVRLIKEEELEMNLLTKKKTHALGNVKLRLFTNRVEIIKESTVEVIDFKDISCHVQYTNTLIIHSFLTGVTYHFTPTPRFNAYKYVLFSKIYQKKVLNNDNEL